MKSYQILYEGSKSFEEELNKIKRDCSKNQGCRVIFYITWAVSSRDYLDDIAEQIEEHFPDAVYYGNEAFGNISDGDILHGIVITCAVFEEPDTKTKLLWVEEGTELGSLDDLWSCCRKEEGLKAVELIPSIAYLDILNIENSVPNISEDILIAGAASVNYDNTTFEAEIFAKGHPLTHNGMAVILFFGEQINFSTTYILGWKGLGRYMTVTKSHDKVIEELDNIPARSVYEKYLGLEGEDRDNLVFPLIVEEDGFEYIRTPQAFLEDKSMKMFVNIEEGSAARIAYGDKNTILQSLYEKMPDMVDFQPQIIKAYSCAARRLFWGDDEVYKETLPLQDVAPVFGFYTGGEIIRIGKKLRVLNSTLVLIGFREGEINPSKKKKEVPFKSVDKSLISRITHFVEAVADDQALQEVKLQEALALADSANKAKTEFLFNMSHDIRTPMNAIIGFTNMAHKYIDDREKVKDCLDKTQQSSELLLSLINNVLEVSRIESGKATVERQEGDVYFSFTNIEDTMRVMAESKDITLTFEFGDIRDRFVYCDFGRCLRVFVNIISNAIKYTREGGYVKVKCEQIGRLDENHGLYRYTFEDNGIGMSEDYQKHVFEQFSRERSTTATGIQGTGLGMAVSKSFVTLMNGTISCESKLGEGTTFIVELPFEIQEGQKFTDPRSKEVTSIIATKVSHKSLAGRKVLLTDDNELNREIAVDILKEEGLVVEQACDGSEAVGLVKEKGPDYYDFLLMDIQMPIMNGYEATKVIREMYPDKHIPIIALSANAFAEDRAASIAAGMDAHVAKPINMAELIGAVINHL